MRSHYARSQFLKNKQRSARRELYTLKPSEAFTPLDFVRLIRERKEYLAPHGFGAESRNDGLILSFREHVDGAIEAKNKGIFYDATAYHARLKGGALLLGPHDLGVSEQQARKKKGGAQRNRLRNLVRKCICKPFSAGEDQRSGTLRVLTESEQREFFQLKVDFAAELANPNSEIRIMLKPFDEHTYGIETRTWLSEDGMVWEGPSDEGARWKGNNLRGVDEAPEEVGGRSGCNDELEDLFGTSSHGGNNQNPFDGDTPDVEDRPPQEELQLPYIRKKQNVGTCFFTKNNPFLPTIGQKDNNPFHGGDEDEDLVLVPPVEGIVVDEERKKRVRKRKEQPSNMGSSGGTSVVKASTLNPLL